MRMRERSRGVGRWRLLSWSRGGLFIWGALGCFFRVALCEGFWDLARLDDVGAWEVCANMHILCASDAIRHFWR